MNTPQGWHRHKNGGGLVQDTATVERTAYVGPNAAVSGRAQVYGEARSEAFVLRYTLDPDDEQTLGVYSTLIKAKCAADNYAEKLLKPPPEWTPLNESHHYADDEDNLHTEYTITRFEMDA